MKLQVVVASNQLITRECIASVLEAEPSLDVSTENPEQHARPSSNPDVVVYATDGRPDLTRNVAALRQAYPAAKLLLLLLVNDEARAKSALRLGVDGLADCTVGSQELIECVLELATSPFVVSRELAHRLAKLHATPINEGSLSTLTRREMDVLRLLVDGPTNREIAEKLDLSEHTVRAHMRVIMQKLQVTNRVKAASLAWQGYLVGESEEALQTNGSPGR